MLPGRINPRRYGFGVERFAGELAQRSDHLGNEVVPEPGRIEAQLAPLQGEHAGRDRSPRHARDPIDCLQDAALVQTPDDAGVKHHRAVTAAGQAKPDAWFGSPFGFVARDQLNWSIGHGRLRAPVRFQGVSGTVFNVTLISRPCQPQDERGLNAAKLQRQWTYHDPSVTGLPPFPRGVRRPIFGAWPNPPTRRHARTPRARRAPRRRASRSRRSRPRWKSCSIPGSPREPRASDRRPAARRRTATACGQLVGPTRGFLGRAYGAEVDAGPGAGPLRSPPPCGEGSAVGIERKRLRLRNTQRPPSLALPLEGGGNTLPEGRYPRTHQASAKPSKRTTSTPKSCARPRPSLRARSGSTATRCRSRSRSSNGRSASAARWSAATSSRWASRRPPSCWTSSCARAAPNSKARSPGRRIARRARKNPKAASGW